MKMIGRLGTGSGGLLGTLGNYNMSAVVLPTSISHRVAAYAGAPVVTVPMGYFPQGHATVLTERGLAEQAEGVP